MKYYYVAQKKFWKNYAKLPLSQKESTKKAWQYFKQDPFDPRLRSYKIHTLSERYSRTIYAACIEGDLRVLFYIEKDIVYSIHIGNHSIYN